MDNEFLTSTDGLFLYHQRLAVYKWLRHGFSLRKGVAGKREMGLGFNGYQTREKVAENRKILVRSLFGADLPLTLLKQVHSDTVLRLPSSGRFFEIPEGDGLITDQPEIAISVQTADCLPVLLADPERRVIASIHAGWRGTLNQIVRKAVKLMRAEFQSNPEECVALVGPSIRGCCYEVGAEVVDPFIQEFGDLPCLFREPLPGKATREGTQFLDLAQACRKQLLDEGLLPENIMADGPCTSCHKDRFFSHRAEAGKTGRMLAVIGITKTD